MANDYDRNKCAEAGGESLEELLNGVSDERERERLTKAWAALGGLVCVQDGAPRPSSELDSIFKGGDEQLSDNELEMLAAAGAQTGPVNGEAPGQAHGLGCGDGGQANGRDQNTTSDWLGEADEVSLTREPETPAFYPEEDWGEDVLTRDSTTSSTDHEVGGDVFVFGPKDGHHEIEDFSPLDSALRFEGGAADGIVVEANDHGDTVITFGDTVVVLKGISLDRSQVLACLDRWQG